ncbi:S41 family peptidase [Advenella sp. RU8]|uniref:S41 family peptidase n=1 Tax=Advenella sp. RU8 TaxID=3399575 RepID=UPI003AAB6A40
MISRKQLVSYMVAAGLLLTAAMPAWAQKVSHELPYEDLQRFARVFAAVKNNYVEPVSNQALIASAIKGMVSDLDPHSSFLDEDEFEEMKESTDGEFGGLGIEIGAEQGLVKIIAPIEDTPAAKAGIMPGDLIVKINGESTEGKPLSDVIKQLRGEPGSEIVLTVKRSSSAEPLDIKIVRDIIQVRSVRSKRLPDDIGYVRISQFQERTGADLAQQLTDLGKNKPLKGLVLDLRNDPGGLLNAAIGVSAAFIEPNKLVVSTKAREQEMQRYLAVSSEYAPDGSDYLKNLPDWTRKVPLVVLINVGSASASEIVAGALQDYKRATIMGNRSFGKGSVQVVMPLDDNTGIKLTTARYYTPLGRSIQATGIEPDIIVSDTATGDLFSFPREADLNDHLNNEQAPKTDAQGNINPEKMSEMLKEPEEMFEFGSEDDFQLQQAINHLTGKKVDQGVITKEKPKGLTKEEMEAVNPSTESTTTDAGKLPNSKGDGVAGDKGAEKQKK